ncbi:NBAS subunit of NRZ tethering complex [Notamacropus eugenii]|uniref:NBAS subunit of NRZ tethering complex n=1 Tax=Notamacropus eugenii TaxID=9315 RepID=UPI003B66C424
MAAAEESPSSGPAPDSEDENILYDLLVNTEWPPETEVQPRGNRKHGASLIITKVITGPLHFLRQYIWYSPTTFLLPDGLVRLVSKQINWHLVLASNGKLLAAVQDQCVEIRSAKDDFTSIVGKCQVPKDPSPQWRRVAWSYDCTLLAYAESTGTVRVFDLMGSELFFIPPASSFPRDLSYAVAGLIFLEYKASAQWSAELLVINYRGELRSYLVSVGTNQGYQESHSFSFSGHYPRGVNTAIYHPGHRLLLVGGCETDDVGTSKARAWGLSAWRVLSGSPYYKPVSLSGDSLAVAPKTLGLLRIFSVKLYSRQGQEQDGVYKMSLSPDGTILAAIHFSGKLSFWTIPSLAQLGEWQQEEQPGYDAVNPNWRLSTEKRKKIKDKESFYPLIDVNWWADNAVTLARCSGALTVSSVKTLKNLLGKSCEWFEPSPQVTAAHDGGFLSLECEIRLAPKRSRLETRPEEEEDGDEDSDSEDEMSAKARYFSYIKQGLYFVTEMERFAPPRKRPRTITKNYRLVSLRSTTPEELYQRKIENEEYHEALSLAQTYGLDTDLVYQRQWRKSTVNIASIQNYLSKIKKRAWVLHECLERVPENVEAAKELLQYGLKGTDLEALLAIGKGEDNGRFILPGDVDLAEVPYEDLLSPAEDIKNAKERQPKKRPELLHLADFSQLTLEQKELCRCRLKLLTYLDRLATYEEILGMPHAAEQRYDAEFFKKFRNQNIVLSARTYARESNVQALGILFTYHGAELLAHRLAILSNFPETTSPHEYAGLLPEACFAAGSLTILPWNEQKHRDKDWCEESACRMVVEPILQDEGGFLYEDQPELLKYRTSHLSIDLVTDWYCARGEDIEHYARQVDCALSLIRLGMERNIPGLLRLCDDLVTLETLVYEAGCDLTLTLKDLQQMKPIDQLRLLMDSCSEEKYVTNAYQWMIPLLHRWEKQSPGAASQLLREYLVTLAMGDLRLPLKIFQHSKPDLQQRIIPDQDQLMEIALECIYSCERDDQLSCCYDILECLPQRGYGPKTAVTSALHDRVDQLEQILSVSELLEKHGLQKPISFVKNTQVDAEEARKLMIRLTRHTGRKQPPVSESHWKTLLQDMLAMQRTVYTCLEPEACYEIFTESLLCSSRLDTLHLAGQMMQRSAGVNGPQKGKAPFRVSYEKSVALVLAASREYFNSSTNLADGCMDLARSCLQLITDCPRAVQEELDLIRALGYLEEFGVKSLPLQVRLCSDRLSLIKECISQAPTCYKQSAKLLGLANLLQVAGEDQEERKGQVLVLLVQQALHFQDYKAASMHCQELMATGYSPSWDVCSQLGQCESFQDLAARQELMAFALTHCPPGSIEGLLAASSSLQTQILYQRVNFQMCPSEGGENPNVSILPAQCLNKGPLEDEDGIPTSHSGDLLHWTTATTMKVLSNTSTTTKAVLHAVSDGQWWKRSLAYLRPLHGQDFCDVYGRGVGANADLEKQGCHPFYESLLASPFVSEAEVTYTKYQHTAMESFAEVLLRTGKLAEIKSEGDGAFPTTEVLLQLASDAFPHDMTLALAYLLALPQVMDASKCFEKQVPSALSLQLAAYYYSLQIYAHLVPCFQDQCHPLYRADPSELVRTVTKHVSDLDGHAWPDDLGGLVQQLSFYHERLLDLTQAQLLQGLRKGVDVARFTADDQYKRETILGLAETLENNVYNIALSLAQRYSVPRWEVYMTHLEFLFTDTSLSTTEIDGRAQALGLLETLKADPDLFHERMAKYVYPGIGGTDHERLLYFFSLLVACGCAVFGKRAITPDTHVRLLKKLKVVASGLNYKKLTDDRASPLDALEPVLSSQNILSISKLASKIPEPDGSMLSPSSLYTVWLQKLFWRGDPQLIKKAPESIPEWLCTYDVCARYFDRLHPGDLLTVLDAMTFSPKALTKLTVDARTEMTRRAVTTVKHFIEKRRKRSPDQDSEEPAAFPVTYEDALSHLEQSLAHLETLQHSFITSLKTSEQDILRHYADVYDLSRSEKAKIQEQAITMCLDGQPLAMVQQLLEVAVGPLDLSTKTIVHGAVMRVLSLLSGGSPDQPVPGGPLQVLESIISSVHASVEKGERLLSSDDLLEWFRPFCADDALPIKPRVQVLQSMERSFHLTDEDSKLLVFFRTEAVLKATWPQTQITVSDIENEERRSTLFSGLLEASHQQVEFQHLALLLQAWPPVKSVDLSSRDDNPWMKLAAAMLSRCMDENKAALGQDVLTLCRSLYHTPQSLPLECVKELALMLLSRSLLLPALKLLVESQDTALQALALEQITAVAQVDESNCDPELLSLLLDAKLVTGCISTPFYPHLINHLLAHQKEGPWSVDETALQLREAGHSVEAGSLLLASRGIYSALCTFSAALGAARHWI